MSRDLPPEFPLSFSLSLPPPHRLDSATVTYITDRILDFAELYQAAANRTQDRTDREKWLERRDLASFLARWIRDRAEDVPIDGS